VNKGFAQDVKQLHAAEQKILDLTLELEDLKLLFEENKSKLDFYELVAEFTFGWEIWIDSERNFKYCSPSCYQLTGYTANQIINSKNFTDLIVYETDRNDFDQFLSKSLDQLILNQAHEFRILTLHKEIRWCSMSVRGVYDKQGRYLGIRASIHNISHLKKALGKIQTLSAGKEIENRAKLRFRSELDLKERELVSFLLQLSQKNEFIAYAINNLKVINNSSVTSIKSKIAKLISALEDIPVVPVDWEMMVLQLENLYPGFLDRLNSRHPNLTPKEKKLCAFLRLDLSSRDISGLQNVLPKSVEIARVRLRKKLKLNRELRLSSYVHSI